MAFVLCLTHRARRFGHRDGFEALASLASFCRDRTVSGVSHTHTLRPHPPTFPPFASPPPSLWLLPVSRTPNVALCFRGLMTCPRARPNQWPVENGRCARPSRQPIRLELPTLLHIGHIRTRRLVPVLVLKGFELIVSGQVAFALL